MTNEQLIIYLYGIYPDGGPTFFYWSMVSVASFYLLIIFTDSTDYTERKNEDHRHYYKKSDWYKMGKIKIAIVAIPLTLIVLSNFIPNKNVFLALVATPTVVSAIKESLDDGKLKRIDNIFNKALNKAEQALDENSTK